jgi:hypothetical protein
MPKTMFTSSVYTLNTHIRMHLHVSTRIHMYLHISTSIYAYPHASTCIYAYPHVSTSISNNLTWVKQVSEQCTKSNRMLGFVRRNTRFITRTSVRRSIYLTLVRYHLGYATKIWAPQSKELIERLKWFSDVLQSIFRTYLFAVLNHTKIDWSNWISSH